MDYPEDEPAIINFKFAIIWQKTPQSGLGLFFQVGFEISSTNWSGSIPIISVTYFWFVLISNPFQIKITFWSQLKAILLLHGAAFSSETWESVGTLDMLNELGVSTVTIDLPSYHNSAKVTIPKNKIEYLSFIREQFEILNSKKIFIISPSMSGKVGNITRVLLYMVGKIA